MDRYHTSRHPIGDPIVMPGDPAVPSPRPAQTAAQEMAKRIADKYIADPKAPPTAPLVSSADVPSSVSPAPAAPQQAPRRMSKLNELAAALTDIPKQVEEAADKALTRLTSARQSALGGIDKIHTIADGIEQSAKDIENFTNQLTNGGPPLEPSQP
jgi:hypothetical protein